jgi:hypothetical protein
MDEIRFSAVACDKCAWKALFEASECIYTKKRQSAKVHTVHSWRIAYFVLVLLATIMLFLSDSNVLAARCQVGNVSYAYPNQAAPSQQIQIATMVTGSCVSDGQDYYSVRVDLVDISSSSIISSSSTPIGYNANNFTVRAENLITTPSNNGTWTVGIDVYVIRAGGTGGSYLLDYRTIGNATIQIGPPAAVPEFPLDSGLAMAAALCLAVTIIRRNEKPERAARKN